MTGLIKFQGTQRLSAILLLLLIGTLAGCEQKTTFNRMQALNEYAYYSPESTPYSRIIKQQVAKEVCNNGLQNTTTIKSDATGRITYYQLQSEQNTEFDMEYDINYQTNQFNLERAFFSANLSVQNGSVIFNSNNQIESAQGLQDSGEPYSMHYTYDKNKVASIKEKFGNFHVQLQYDWRDNLIVNSSMEFNLYQQPFLRVNGQYNYDQEKKIDSISFNMHVGDDYQISGRIAFEEYNEYGDWTHANIIYSDDNTFCNVQRQISYF